MALSGLWQGHALQARLNRYAVRSYGQLVRNAKKTANGQPLGKSGAVDQPTPPEWELFDLKKDPREMRNVYGDPAYAKVQEHLKKEMYRLKTHYGDTE